MTQTNHQLQENSTAVAGQSTLRNRQNNQAPPPAQATSFIQQVQERLVSIYNADIDLGNRRIVITAIAVGIIAALFLLGGNRTLNPFYQDFTNKGEKIVDRLFELQSQLPGTAQMNQYRAKFRELGTIFKKSTIVPSNGVAISSQLFGLSDNIHEANEDIAEFSHKASLFVFALRTEMAAIGERHSKQKNSKPSNSEKDDDDDEKYVRKRLEVLANKIPGLRVQLEKAIGSLSKIGESSKSTHEYLMDGEMEAELKVKKHMTSDTFDQQNVIKAKRFLTQIKKIIKMVTTMSGNLNDFDSFLKDYQRKLLDVEKDVEENKLRLKLNEEDLTYLKESARRLKKQHQEFDETRKLRQIAEKKTLPYDVDGGDDDDDDDDQHDQGCATFRIWFLKPNNSYWMFWNRSNYLRKIRVWASTFVNALGFFYGDEDVVLIGSPDIATPIDFDLSQGERITTVDYFFDDDTVYALNIKTNFGRSTGWIGSRERPAKLNQLTSSDGKKLVGLEGSIDQWLCSIKIIEE